MREQDLIYDWNLQAPSVRDVLANAEVHDYCRANLARKPEVAP